MIDYPIILKDNHIIIDYKGAKYLIDTGAPISIAKNDFIEFQGKDYSATQSFSGFDLDKLIDGLGFEFDVLIGGNILKDFIFQIDLKRNFFSAFTNDHLLMLDKYGHSEIELVSNIPIFNIYVNNTKNKVYLDTGAKLSYIKKELLNGAQVIGEEEDFYPGYGRFKTPTYKLTINTDTVLGYISEKKNINLTFGILPKSLEALYSIADANAIIGNDIFSWVSIIFYYQRKKIFYINQR